MVLAAACVFCTSASRARQVSYINSELPEKVRQGLPNFRLGHLAPFLASIRRLRYKPPHPARPRHPWRLAAPERPPKRLFLFQKQVRTDNGYRQRIESDGTSEERQGGRPG